ncbi:S8 family serine peptidase [Kribbella sp. CA-247076]|uniref:S8 family serine peptidase n=1 Tax=Kribbella sp. CA-247076 TaxID=3239941 RepID=UPI003D8ED1BC
MNLFRALPRRAALLLTGILVMSGVTAPGAASASTPPAASASTPPAASASTPLAAPRTQQGPATVTLLTGDRVTLRPGQDGKPLVDVRARDGRSGPSGFSIRHEHGRVSVVPHDVERLVPDVLDPALFDVTGLVEMRYDDAHRADLPVIVRDAPRTLAASEFVPTRALASVDATAGRIQKAGTRTFGAALVAPGAPRPAKIWLDRAVRGDSLAGAQAAPLDGFLTQVQAPAAWKRGLDGRGVKVAIVDSGIDAGHPALAGKVTATADFTGEGPQDDVGHGTHVASLVAGTGAGADGARQGVAPAAELISGKVLNADNQGTESSVIAGMEWAVGQDADLVNLSLGGRADRFGTDLMAAAVDRLTAQSGALFVVAAGNSGAIWPTPFSIETPGTAASALTVGAVDRTDHKAYFSSEGPTWSYRQKPEVSAPGVDIVGARAGARDGDLYTAMSGTSQATPLVTGAAALLLQQHPELTWQRLKARLSSAVDDTGRYTSWSGSGRVNLDKATSAGLSADVGVVDFGAIRHPDDSAQTRTVTLTNPTDEPVAVSFADHQTTIEAKTAPEGAVVATPAALTIPARGTASTTLTLDPAALTDTMWQGSLDVLGADGKQLLRLALNAYDEPPMYDLSVRVLDRDGKPFAGGYVTAFNAGNGGFTKLPLDSHGRSPSVRLPPGEYNLSSIVPTGDTVAMTGAPDFVVNRDTTVTLDARKAVRLNAPAVEGQPTKVTQGTVSFLRSAVDGRWYADYLELTAADLAAGRIYVQPTAAPKYGTFEATTRWRLEPTTKARPDAPDVYEVYQSANRFTLPLAKNLDRKALRAMARVESTYGSVWGGGVRAMTRNAIGPAGFGVSMWRTVETPSRRVELLSAGPNIRWVQCVDTPASGISGLCDAPGRSYKPGERVRSVSGTAMHPQLNLADIARGSFNVQVGLADADHVGIVDTAVVGGQRLKLYRNDVPVGELAGPSGFFEAAAGPARWRLEHSWSTDQVPTSGQAKTTWTFDATPPAEDQNPVRPSLLRLNYDPYGAADGSAPAWRPLLFDLGIGYQPEVATAPVKSVKLWVSSDRGKHWTPAPLFRAGAGYRTIVAPWSLLPGRTLSVRATVTDKAGNSIDQTVLDLIPVR